MIVAVAIVVADDVVVAVVAAVAIVAATATAATTTSATTDLQQLLQKWLTCRSKHWLAEQINKGHAFCCDHAIYHNGVTKRTATIQQQRQQQQQQLHQQLSDR